MAPLVEVGEQHAKRLARLDGLDPFGHHFDDQRRHPSGTHKDEDCPTPGGNEIESKPLSGRVTDTGGH